MKNSTLRLSTAVLLASNYSPADQNGSRFVDLTIVGRVGKFLHSTETR